MDINDSLSTIWHFKIGLEIKLTGDIQFVHNDIHINILLVVNNDVFLSLSFFLSFFLFIDLFIIVYWYTVCNGIINIKTKQHKGHIIKNSRISRRVFK